MNYIVVDLEMTCSDDGSISKEQGNMETIEIGAVAVSGTTHRIIGQFQCFVRPIVNPQLTAFAISLTTIEQSDVDEAKTFPSSWCAFNEWIYLFGESSFCCWGGYDWTQLKIDCERHGVYFFDSNMKVINLARQLKKQTGKLTGARRAMKRFGIDPIGTQHRGIDDAVNYSKLLPYCMGWK